MEINQANDPFDLERFVKAQQDVYSTAFSELKAGRKRSHWMWFVFPQIDGLGHSPTTIFYAIKSLEEAKAYLEHPTLGTRLIECTQAVMANEGTSLLEIFGKPDNKKFCACMTLFAKAAENKRLFEKAIDQFCESQLSDKTLEALNRL
ncbi:MAG: DUF1810 domain-containing protein [Thiomicrorhabdus chilensis]|uniref:DUF1810 domain-containing protein n=1 Tax=Thiomicrorhabdus chilensis TaxID=63656 RepID=UPI00299D0B47|nr:DUF1810 domain-containing protein [Thiomicrorhabdus chilensis]MDX1348454.1 DUF1810 domain-containing protein [Thiomicrorhabdus chilensis]